MTNSKANTQEYNMTADEIFELLEKAHTKALEFQELQCLGTLETAEPQRSDTAFTWNHPLTLVVRDARKD